MKLPYHFGYCSRFNWSKFISAREYTVYKNKTISKQPEIIVRGSITLLDVVQYFKIYLEWEEGTGTFGDQNQISP